MTSAFLPAPYLGVNELTPIAAVKSPQCQNLLNFNVTQAGIVLRHGDALFSSFNHSGDSGATGGDIIGMWAYGQSGKLIVAIRDRLGSNKIDFVDAETGTVEYTSIAPLATTTLNAVYFNKYLFFYGNTSTLAPGIYYNGSAWSTSGYTGTNLWPIGGNVFKHRQYMIQLNEAAYWYSPVDAISGACTKVDLSSIVANQTTLSSIGSFTLATQYGGSETFQAFVMANGEVLFYSGSFPDGNDWNQIGSANIAQPLAPNSTIQYQGDTLVMTDVGIVSLRDLFLTGSQEASSLTLNKNTTDTWVALVQAIRSTLSTPVGPITGSYAVGRIRGVFDKKNNRIVVSFPYYLAESGDLYQAGFFFIFDNQQGAWFYHLSNVSDYGTSGIRIYDITVYKNAVRMIGKVNNTDEYFMVSTKEGATGFTDTSPVNGTSQLAIYYQTISAPIPYKKDAVYSINGIEPILESDLYAETDWTLIADFGRQETEVQNVDAPTTSVQKPMVNLGITANFVQVKIAGTTAADKTVGLQLYGYNVWFEAGEQGSR